MNPINLDMSVLIIDDQRFQRSYLVRLLREIGVHEIHEACNGQNALDLLGKVASPVDLIISDIDMPKMDGLEFLRLLGCMAPRTTILIHSVLEQSLLHSVEAMAVEYGLTPIGLLADPVTVDSLTIALERAQLHLHEDRSKDAPLAARGEVEEGMRRKEFEPWFQPKIDLRSGAVIGVEALLRWRRKDHVLLPARFLTVLEDAGLLMECTLRVAARAAECITMILDKAKGFTVAVNVTPTLLDDPNFARALSKTLIGSGARPEHIVIEVTETAMAQNQGAMLENLARLRMHGFRISLDDFCTGYSSMSRLACSPFSEIKIDRSFVGKMYPGNREWMMIESTIVLAQRLGLYTVAEGVENEHQLEALKHFGCDSAQGFLIARPMPILELMRWIERGREPSPDFGSTSQLAVTYS